MPQDTATLVRAARRHADFDFTKPLVWDTPDCLEEFAALTSNPPLHSVVIHLSPTAAEQLLLVTNKRNRVLSPSWVNRMKFQLETSYALTGDTLKFSSKGEMIDGQHRLEAAVKLGKDIITHVVFGLDDTIFDIIDQGKRRSPSDIVYLRGVPEYVLVAAAVGWAVRMQERSRGNWAHNLTARRIGELSCGKMKTIAEYVNDARLISKAFKHPPSIVAALLYLIGRRDAGLARSFAHEWVHGARIDRNENFDVFSNRIITMQRQGGGHINSTARAAIMVQAFNYWNAGIVASQRGLFWKKTMDFPVLEFDGEAFKARAEEEIEGDSSLSASQLRVLRTIGKAKRDKDGNVTMSHSEIATEANVPVGTVSYLVTTLIEQKLVHRSKKGDATSSAMYRIKPEGELRLARK